MYSLMHINVEKKKVKLIIFDSGIECKDQKWKEWDRETKNNWRDVSHLSFWFEQIHYEITV